MSTEREPSSSAASTLHCRGDTVKSTVSHLPGETAVEEALAGLGQASTTPRTAKKTTVRETEPVNLATNPRTVDFDHDRLAARRGERWSQVC
ncbi:hypothetical protein [Nocardia sp. NPDC051981]|uniref:hypothetical protein n=1 Tax=Nocardia sp. NPDC051981 TaxID=3155417 RepID=UPI0034132799